MKKVTLLAVAILFSGSALFAANHPVKALADTTKTKKMKPAKVMYTCTMHPEVVTDKPGKCPKCGMTLVKKAPAKAKSAPAEKMKM